MPSIVLSRVWNCSPVSRAFRRSTPEKAAGTEPMQRKRTRRRLTAPWRMWTPAPTGFITSEAMRSLETAARGWTPKTSTMIGVMSAPPPMPVRPTMKPTMKPATETSTAAILHHAPWPRNGWPVESAPNRSMSRRFAELRGRFLTERVIRARRDPSG